MITTIVGFSMLFSPLSANIYFPAINELKSALRTSAQNINLTITIYLVGISSAMSRNSRRRKKMHWSIGTFPPANGLRDVLMDNVVSCLSRLKFTPDHFFPSFMEEELKKVFLLLARGQLDSNIVAKTCPTRG